MRLVVLWIPLMAIVLLSVTATPSHAGNADPSVVEQRQVVKKRHVHHHRPPVVVRPAVVRPVVGPHVHGAVRPHARAVVHPPHPHVHVVHGRDGVLEDTRTDKERILRKRHSPTPPPHWVGHHPRPPPHGHQPKPPPPPSTHHHHHSHHH
ncbi:hypothetical protein M514_23090 [Trichuris suis]|nr:hypothetical protein M514_23090 [Trichuris suis]